MVVKSTAILFSSEGGSQDGVIYPEPAMCGGVGTGFGIMKGSLSISQLGRRFGLSRSTLLYYDRIGLLRASGRTALGHRVYGEREVRRLQRICDLRKVGLSMRDIHVMLSNVPDARSEVIADRLREVAAQIVSLRNQQRLLVSLYKGVASKPLPPLLDKLAWIEMLRQAGMDERGMSRWHAEFERRAPEEHEQFLSSLGIPLDEIAMIRRRSRALVE